jgi:sugar-phosphatase
MGSSLATVLGVYACIVCGVPDIPVIDAVIFDMDGVLIDTEPVWRRVETEIFKRVGMVLEYEDTAETMGMPIRQVVQLRHSQQPWDTPSIDEVADEILRRVVDFVATQGVPIPGAVESVQTAAKLGIPVGLATSSAHLLIDAVVDRLQLRDYFSACSSSEDVESGKPSPDIYIHNAALLGVAAQRCLAIEDSRSGVAAALAAGMICCAIPDAHWNGDPDVARAHYRLESVSELPEWLRHRLVPG